MVRFDGRELGETPVSGHSATPGFHEVLLQLDDYETLLTNVEVREGGQNAFHFELEPVVGYVTIESEPAGAWVRLDEDARIGETPIYRYALPVGEHRIEIGKEHYNSRIETVDVEEYYHYPFTELLQPKEARLTVFSRPSGAMIWINNLQQAEKTPATFNMPPGPYLVSVYAEDHVQEEGRIVLTPEGQATVRLTMKPGKVPPGMVLVPAGEFLWGEDNRAPDEAPQRKVFLDAFYIDKYEVSNRDFKAVFPEHEYLKGQDEFPVSGVSWTQATEYAKRVGKRLPTEGEWEKAARGEDGREYPWGMSFDVKCANTEEAHHYKTTNIWSHLDGLSPYGCMNMAGNVYEWTQDLYQTYPGNTVVTKEYGQSFRVLRGGSYATPRFTARCARRHFDHLDAARSDYGFRCALDFTE